MCVARIIKRPMLCMKLSGASVFGESVARSLRGNYDRLGTILDIFDGAPAAKRAGALSNRRPE